MAADQSFREAPARRALILYCDGSARMIRGRQRAAWAVVAGDEETGRLRFAVTGLMSRITRGSSSAELRAMSEAATIAAAIVASGGWTSALIVTDNLSLEEDLRLVRSGIKKRVRTRCPDEREAIGNMFGAFRDCAAAGAPVRISWVRGHNGDPLNGRADWIARSVAGGAGPDKMARLFGGAGMRPLKPTGRPAPTSVERMTFEFEPGSLAPAVAPERIADEVCDGRSAEPDYEDQLSP